MGVATADVVVRTKKKGERVYRDVQEQLDRLNRKVKAFGLLAGAVAVGGLTALTVKSFASADALAKSAEKIGISTTRLGALNSLAVQAGSSVGGMQEALTKATKRLGEFNATGGGAAAVWLKRLNLDTKELAGLSPDQLFGRYSDAIGGLNTRGEKLAAISALMGDESRALIGLVDQGSAAFDAAEQEVIRYGIALNGVDSAKIEAANDNLFKVGERFKGLGNVIASRVAPIISAMAEQFLASGVDADVMGSVVDRVMDGIATAAGVVADAIFGWKLLFAAIKVASLEFSATIVGGLATVERAVIAVGNKMADVFGGDQVDVNSGFLSKMESSLRASALFAEVMLQKLSSSEAPSIGIAKALEKVRIEAEKAAIATANARDKLLNNPDIELGNSDKEIAAEEKAQKEAQKLRDRLAVRLETVEAALRTETEREQFAFEQRQEIVDNALESGLIAKARALELSADLQQRHEEKLNKITLKGLSEREKFERLSASQKTKTVFGFLDNITSGVANSNKALFRLNQAAAIGNAIVNISEGITKAWSFGPILGPPLAAIVAAAGAAQIAAIASATPGGGTTPSAAGSTPTFNGQPLPQGQSADASTGSASQPGTIIQIFVEGSLVGDEGIKQLLTETITEIVDDDVVLIDASSRQATEIRLGGG